MDQASFLALRALGHSAIMQCIWIYNRPVNVDGLRRLHRALGRGLLGRRIERSPLPFARDRWVSHRGPEDIEIADASRARADLGAWLSERARLAIDPEHGPSWRIGVLPFEGGGAAVSLTTSHTIADGLGTVEAIADAVDERDRKLGYPHPTSRTRGQALLEDAWQTVRAAPELARAVAATVRIGRRRRKEVAASIASAPPFPQTDGEDQPVAVPSQTACVDLAEWNERAQELGGNGPTLLAAFASRLGVRMGRVRSDGSVNLSFPMSERTVDDTRGNALVFLFASIDPTDLSSDLRKMRASIRQALADLPKTSEEMLGPLPLTSFTPKWVARKIAGMGLGAAGLPIGCSYLGELHPQINRIDGDDADCFYGRFVEHGIRKRTLESMGGQLLVVAGQLRGKIFISVNAYLMGRTNTEHALRQDLARTFDEFRLVAEFHD